MPLAGHRSGLWCRSEVERPSHSPAGFGLEGESLLLAMVDRQRLQPSEPSDSRFPLCPPYGRIPSPCARVATSSQGIKMRGAPRWGSPCPGWLEMPPCGRYAPLRRRFPPGRAGWQRGSPGRAATMLRCTRRIDERPGGGESVGASCILARLAPTEAPTEGHHPARFGHATRDSRSSASQQRQQSRGKSRPRSKIGRTNARSRSGRRAESRALCHRGVSCTIEGPSRCPAEPQERTPKRARSRCNQPVEGVSGRFFVSRCYEAEVFARRHRRQHVPPVHPTPQHGDPRALVTRVENGLDFARPPHGSPPDSCRNVDTVPT